MTTNPLDRKYSRDHEWILLNERGALMGITHYAQDQLGDVVFVDLPDVGSQIIQFAKMGEVESVKAVSDLYSPVSGEIVEINQALIDNPQWVNEDPFGKAWMLLIHLANNAELDSLMTAEDYDRMLGEVKD